MKLEIDRVFAAFDDALALVGDEQERERFRLLMAASRENVRHAVSDVVREMLDAVNTAAAGLVHASLVYGPDGAELRVERSAPGAPGATEHDVEFVFDADEIERLTLRVPTELKEIASAAAEQAGISLNAWLTGLLTREAAHRVRVERHEPRAPSRGSRRTSGQSLKGWIGD